MRGILWLLMLLFPVLGKGQSVQTLQTSQAIGSPHAFQTPKPLKTPKTSKPPQASQSTISVHDPVMIRSQGRFYLFCTGPGVSVWSSVNMKDWKKEPAIFPEGPAWAVQAIPGFKNHIWAPDISYYNGYYYLYYSVSAFGKNTSAIGVATNKTLNSKDPNYHWKDYGKVIQSYPGRTNWNAIDPNLVTDNKGNPYLAFGSFWGGLKLARLTKDRLKIEGDTINLPTIASRAQVANVQASNAQTANAQANVPAVGDNPPDAGRNAIEGPFMFKKNKYYYLFASIDYCCKGPKSDYKMIVGRAKQVGGPYLDKKGIDMAKGGGSILLQGDKDWYGLGHNAVCSFEGEDYLVYHAYDATDNGKPKLQIKKLKWSSKGWPETL
jgi:arabinan endo-1,5-alpha-L-arabinosidase